MTPTPEQPDAHPAPASEPSRYERFTRLFLANQRRVYGFILSAVPSVPDADDLLQETNLAMWESFDEFDESAPGSDFAAWGIAIARFRVLRHYRSKSESAARFSDATLDLLADQMAAASFDPDQMHEALAACLAGLDEAERQIIQDRYHEDKPAADIAERLGLSVFTLYKRLNKIYAKLLGCIQRNLAEEDTR